jgi:beta-hydroxyacyl-ACP dehydratase FabZ
METAFNITEILSFLPHRYPFILVDRIITLTPDQEIQGLKNVTINEPFFQGHFPQEPIMPGVLILESMAQTGGILALASLPTECRGAPIYMMGMDKVRFRKPVVPGDQLMIEVKLIRKRKTTYKMSGVSSVAGVRAAEAEIMAIFGD